MTEFKTYTIQINLQSENGIQLFEDYLNQQKIKYEYLSFVKMFIIETLPSNISEIQKLEYILSVVESRNVSNALSIVKPPYPPHKKEDKEDFLNYGVNQIKAPYLWKKGITGKDINVAVLDTGVVPHKYLQISGEISYIPGEAPTQGINPNDGSAHGTHVASIIGARGHDDGIVGIAYDCNLFNVKVMSSTGQFAWPSSVINAINWCGLNNINVVNMSFHYEHIATQAELNQVEYVIGLLAQTGCILVAAAGNQNVNKLNSPAYIDEVIAVGSIDRNDIKATFSNYGERIDYVAPGVNIVSTGPQDNTAIMSGTSMSSPHVTGLVALLLSEDIKEGNPLKSLDEIQSILNENALDLGSPGYDLIFGYGGIQAKGNK